VSNQKDTKVMTAVVSLQNIAKSYTRGKQRVAIARALVADPTLLPLRQSGNNGFPYGEATGRSSACSKVAAMSTKRE
jgi:predicted ABC-type transport system involved in lysophospholipase L1 biosynthesis ATPase subunit